MALLLFSVALTFCSVHVQGSPVVFLPNGGRKTCRRSFIYLKDDNNFMKQIAECKKYGALLARLEPGPDGTNNVAKYVMTQAQVFLDRSPDGVEFYIGGKKDPEGNYRWWDGPMIDPDYIYVNVSQGKDADGKYKDTHTSIKKVLDKGRPNRCMTIIKKNSKTTQWKTNSCSRKTYAVCEGCFTVTHELKDCFRHCLCEKKIKFTVEQEKARQAAVTAAADKGTTAMLNSSVELVYDCNGAYGQCPDGCKVAVSNAEKDFQGWQPCPFDRWGPPDCHKQCHCKLDDNGKAVACNLETGICPEALCEGNWTGLSCNKTECPLNTYGPLCDQSCYCQFEQNCDSRGLCDTGCWDGSFGEQCTKTTCPVGKFGINNCDKFCHCQTGSACSKTEGYCFSTNCKSLEWKGRSCNETKCDTGRWGSSCENLCGCEGGQQCDLNTGECPGLCLEGWQPRCGNCSKQCTITLCGTKTEVDETVVDKPVTLYFYDWPNCNRKCSRNCQGLPCGPFKEKTCAVDYMVTQNKRCKEPKKAGKNCNKLCDDEKCKQCNRWDSAECVVCDNKYEVSIAGSCERSCDAPKKWGPDCDRRCLVDDCRRCKKDDGDKCRECNAGFALTPGERCVEKCKVPRKWGRDCNRPCEQQECHWCELTDGAKCDLCIVGWKKNENKHCVRDPTWKESENEIFEGSQSITFHLMTAMLGEAVLCVSLYYFCGCQDTGVDDNDDRDSDDENKTHSSFVWQKTQLFTREDFEQRAKDWDALEEEFPNMNEAEIQLRLNRLAQDERDRRINMMDRDPNDHVWTNLIGEKLLSQDDDDNDSITFHKVAGGISSIFKMGFK